MVFQWLFIMYGGYQVLEGTDDLGMFLVNLSVITEVGLAWATIYETLNEAQSCLPALDITFHWMDLATDVPPSLAIEPWTSRGDHDTARSCSCGIASSLKAG